jgi:tRNA (guanine37-N1)-methyltransferase
MRFDIVTIFPEFFGGPLEYGIVRRAREARLIETHVHDLRDFTHDRHHVVDDRPFGGGEGMVMKPEPIFEAVESLAGEASPSARPGVAIVLLSASGKMFRQETAWRFAKLDRMILLCGRYEGIDERVAEHLATDEISIGDFILSGGELPAAMILDAVTRLIPGALGNEDSTVNESFSVSGGNDSPDKVSSGGTSSASISVDLGDDRAAVAAADATDRARHGPGLPSRISTNRGILDYPHYTRPQSFRGWDVPEVLVGGNHEEIRRWRRKMAIEKTLRNRPDLIDAPADIKTKAPA